MCIFKRLLLIVFGACVQLTALVAAAQSDKPFAAPREISPAVDAGGSLAQVTLSLVLVLATVFAAAWVVRRLRGFGRLGAQAITVIADVGLGPKERAVLVQVGGKQLLLGVAPGRVSTLYVLEEPVVVLAATTSAAGAAPPEAPAIADFKAILKRSLGLKP